MKLIIQIPCFNEEKTLPVTIRDLPKKIKGIDIIETLIIDDGSKDDTVKVAKMLKVDHIIKHTENRGLARSFRTGINACLQLGADIIVNTDADNQYYGPDIQKLVKPILDGKADIVIGDRQTDKVEHFSPLKKMLQKFGSKAISSLAGKHVSDVVSGFRAFSKDAALQMNIVSTYSYTTETVIQAGKKHLAVMNVPIKVNGVTRKSRLLKSIPDFIKRSAITVLRAYTMFQPLRVFLSIGLILFLIGIIPIARFIYFYLIGAGDGHIQSLILGSACVMLSIVSILSGLLADLISFNRQLIEFSLEKIRRIEINTTPKKPKTK